jgi:FkbM family methyltransferase
MRVPFKKTLKNRKIMGTSKAAAIALVVIFNFIHKKLVYLPEKTLIMVNGSKMLVAPRKGGIDFELFIHKKREPLCTDYLQTSGILKPGDTVLDAGANIGYYALLESQIVGPSGQVYAVEPVKETFQNLTNNITLNQRKNIHTSRYAFGDKIELGKIYVSASSNLSCVNKDNVGGNVLGVQDVPFSTVDAFLDGKKFPKLVRMDVEGSEYEIILGMKKTLTNNVRLMIELHPKFLNGKLDALFDILRNYGYFVRFVVFEAKNKQNCVMRALGAKSGENFSLIAHNLSLSQLRKIIAEHPDTGPNAIFEKAPARVSA